MSPTRTILKRRDYVATLEGVESFREQLNRCYAQAVQQKPHQVVFLGDGPAWIWLMATVLFPDAIQILDFFHVSEYLWAVARCGFALREDQKAWVNAQQDQLKRSQWPSAYSRDFGNSDVYFGLLLVFGDAIPRSETRRVSLLLLPTQ